MTLMQSTQILVSLLSPQKNKNYTEEGGEEKEKVSPITLKVKLRSKEGEVDSPGRMGRVEEGHLVWYKVMGKAEGGEGECQMEKMGLNRQSRARGESVLKGSNLLNQTVKDGPVEELQKCQLQHHQELILSSLQ